MSIVRSAQALALLVSLQTAQDGLRYADAGAREAIEKSRSAIASGTAAGAIRSLALQGRLRVAEGDGSVDGTVEIKVLLPDRFARVDVVRGAVRRSVFDGRLRSAETPEGRALRTQFTTFLLGALALAPPDRALSARSTGEAGFADTAAIDITGPSYSVRLVIDTGSSLPLRVVSFGERTASTVVSFANRRPVDGYLLPSRVTTQTAERVLETLMFDELSVNPDLREEDFRR